MSRNYPPDASGAHYDHSHRSAPLLLPSWAEARVSLCVLVGDRIDPCFASFGKCASFGYCDGHCGCGLGSSAPAHPARALCRDGAFAVRHGDAGDASESDVGPLHHGCVLRGIAGAASAVFFGAGAAFGVSAIGCGAFLGALALSLILAIAAGRVAPGDSSYLLIFGAAMAAVCGGITSVLVYIGANATGMDVTLYWLMGSVSFAKLLPTLSVLAIVLAFIVFFSTQTRILNLMLEGEETAVPLGRQLLPFRRLYLVMNALLMGSLVTQAGLIGFVGLLVPHGCRMVMGADHRKLLPVSVLSGGLMTVWADILGRILIHGVDIPLGVSLSLIGASVFLGILIRRSYHFGGEGA